MKYKILLGAVLVTIGAVGLFIFYPQIALIADREWLESGNDPDLPGFMQGADFNMEEFIQQREEYIGLRRGVDKDHPVDPKLRQTAIAQMEKQQERVTKMRESSEKDALLAPWTSMGPAPIPNGGLQDGDPTNPSPASGRVSAIAVHPQDSNIVYVGTASGGVYRSTNGGVSWTPIFDSAQSLAIGSIAIAPSQPETIYIGTGEGHFGRNSFFGVGIYRIDNASTTAVLSGPFNKQNFGTPPADVFTGRSISKILVNPANPAIIYVATQLGFGGIGGFEAVPIATTPFTGVYRSFNATSSEPVFQLFGPISFNVEFGLAQPDVHDIAVDPLDFTKLVASVQDGTGLYYSDNALTPYDQFGNPLFRPRTTGYVSAIGNKYSDAVAEFAVQHTAGQPNATFYAASGNGNGSVYRSTDGGINWTRQIDNNFCDPQCGYDIAVGVDPANAAKVYLGGNPNMVFGISNNSATSFTKSEIGLHVDSHAIAVSKSSPSVIYYGTDGGIYKSVDAGSSWISLNNTQFSATQFMSIATHPTDPNFMIGGTQDNGTNFFKPNSTWTRADFGDGGYALIDQNATDTTNVRMYHTYFNNGGLQGYSTVSNISQAQDNGWTFRGCQNAGSSGNGITCNGTVLFYAPLEQGPGNPNTIYFGTDRLYRSSNAGLDNAIVSQNPIEPLAGGNSSPISAIGISPQNDNVRIVGMANGGLWGTTNGSSTLTNLDPGNLVPNNFIARAVIDPNNVNTAYITLGIFNAVNVWKTTNLNNPAPTWVSGRGIGNTSLPSVPVSAFLVDPGNSSTLYAGTDIGVYISTDAGGSWAPLGTGLPRLPVFDMAITSNSKLRIATHGRGIWEIPVDGSPRISINDVSLNEGNTGTTAFNFNVTLSVASAQTVTVAYATANVTATAGSDYTAANGTVTFNPGEISKTVTVLVNGDASIEPTETFNVNLTNSVNAAIADNQGVGTIVNDDAGISINDVSLNEGNSGTTAFSFTVNITPPSPQAVTVNYATANGTAVAPGDYTAVPTTLLVFGAGEASKQITVLVNGDTTVESNETFTVNLSNPSNAIIADNSGLGTIINDDSGGTPTPTPTPTVTPTPPPTPTPTATATPTATPTPTPGGGTSVSYAGPVVAIPDNAAAGVNIPLPVSGVALAEGENEGGINVPVAGVGTITDLNFRIDGTAASADPLSTTVGLNHSWMGDVVIKLTSPSGTTVVIFDRPGLPASSSGCNSNNLFNVTLNDDGSFPPVENQCGASDSDMFPSGSFTPNNPLSAFDGQNANGNWTVNVSDNAGQDTGSMRSFSLVFNSEGAAPSCTASPNVVQDGGFELNTGNPIINPNWASTSTAFGTSLCDASCGTGGGVAPPRTGNGWLWFDGAASGTNAEVGTATQTVTLPAGGTATLNYYLRIGAVTAPTSSTLQLKVDGTTVQTINEPAAAEAAYTLRTVDLSAFANGAAHTISFNYNRPAGTTASDNFTIDDVTLSTTCPVATPTPTPTATPTPAPTPTPTPSLVTVDGRVLTSDNRGLRNASVSMTDPQGTVRTATTSSFGFYSFAGVSTGQTYTFRIGSRLFRFTSQTVQVNGNMTLPDFVGLE